ncbi:MAG: DMT family transporter [Lachnospiraceae bacterium]|nr:DMT family transporter [Lachnospiraceae bacterium]
MLYMLIAVIGGLANPMQSGVNGRLRRKIGHPLYTAVLTFATAPFILFALMILTGTELKLNVSRLFSEPFWVWAGGIIGVFFVTLNMPILQRLGGVQAMVLPAFGQIVGGLIIDHFGLLGANRIPLSLTRAVGAVLVVCGLILVTRSRVSGEKKAGGNLMWQVMGILLGMGTSVQTAANGYVGKIVESPFRASIINFLVGLTLILIICCVKFVRDGRKFPFTKEKAPWWSWLGGACGVVFITANAAMSSRIGTGMTLVCSQVGIMLGGILIDQFGLFGNQKRPATAMKILGVVLMIAGAVVIRLL